MSVASISTGPVIGGRSLRLGLLGFLTVCATATLTVPGEAAQLVGTQGADRLIGTRGADRINGRAGDDRIEGRKGRDRLLGGKGADRIDAADGQKDRVIKAGRGADTCKVDPADQPRVKGCETVKVRGGGAAGCVAAPPEPKAITAAEAQRSARASARRGDPPPPTFSEEFFNTTIRLNAASDGAVEGQLPLSIEEVCDVPEALQTEAQQLVGTDAMAIIGPATTVFQNGVQLEGEAAEMALADLDEVEVSARLLHPEEWVQDEEGNPLPTFEAIQITIVD